MKKLAAFASTSFNVLDKEDLRRIIGGKIDYCNELHCVDDLMCPPGECFCDVMQSRCVFG